jgi:parallel beta-helix repeat protein
MKITNQLKLAAAVAAGITLVGCGSSSSSDDKTPKTDEPFERIMSMAANKTQAVVDLTTIKNSTCFNVGECSASGYTFPQDAIFVTATDGDDITNLLLATINDAGADAVIVLPKGTFSVTKPIAISASQTGLTLVGHGIDQTKLDFIDSVADDGIKVSGANNVVLRDFSVYEAAKNGIKVDQANGVHFNYVATIWENPLTPEAEEPGLNGIYGLYPVGSQNVLVENSYSKGSSDAGIYVGQTSNIVVRHNVAEHNVAGIEIENSSNADVYDNIAFDNTGGLLIFDLDGLDKAFGSNIRLFNNHSYSNNLANAGSGFVGYVPQGTGALVLASDGVEIFNNQFDDNDGQAIALTSYFLIDDDVENYGTKYGETILDGWTPIINNIYIHDNAYKNNASDPDTNQETSLLAQVSLGYILGQNFTGAAVDHPAVVYDGIGELLTNANALAAMGINPGIYDNTMCIENSINQNDNGADLNIGSVYGTNPMEVIPETTTPINFDENSLPTPTLRIGQIDSESNTLMKCDSSPTRLTPSVVTINGEKYGCGSGCDDEGTATCNL